MDDRGGGLLSAGNGGCRGKRREGRERLPAGGHSAPLRVHQCDVEVEAKAVKQVPAQATSTLIYIYHWRTAVVGTGGPSKYALVEPLPVEPYLTACSAA
eukprot:8744161-Pyramimonas_sp.AAC.1